MSEVWIVETSFYIIFEFNIKNICISLYIYIYIERERERERARALTIIIDKERIPVLFF